MAVEEEWIKIQLTSAYTPDNQGDATKSLKINKQRSAAILIHSSSIPMESASSSASIARIAVMHYITLSSN